MSTYRGARLVRGELTGRVYVVTAWNDDGKGPIEAITKFDVTDDFNALALASMLVIEREE